MLIMNVATFLHNSLNVNNIDVGNKTGASRSLKYLFLMLIMRSKWLIPKEALVIRPQAPKRSNVFLLL